MSRYTGPKARHCRRFGVNIYGSDKYDKILAKRNYPPGIHGTKRVKKQSEYGKQLTEKQKAKFMFGITEKQFRKYYEKANSMPGVTGEELLRLLERRLDNVLFRAEFAVTRVQARQMASHGLITVNGKRVTVPSIQVRPGDVIGVREKNSNSTLFKEIKDGVKKINAPSWLKVDAKKLSIEIAALPEKHHLDNLIESQLIVEYYSK